MFEKGGWEESDDDSEEGSDEDEGGEEEADAWDMEEMRRETERVKAERERERIEGLGKGTGGGLQQVVIEGTNGVGGEHEGEVEDQAVGVGEVMVNGVNGHASE